MRYFKWLGKFYVRKAKYKFALFCLRLPLGKKLKCKCALWAWRKQNRMLYTYDECLNETIKLKLLKEL